MREGFDYSQYRAQLQVLMGKAALGRGTMVCIVKRRGRYVLDFHDQHGKRQRKTLRKLHHEKEGGRGTQEGEKSGEQGSREGERHCPAAINELSYVS
jgi:hypothetical protein